MRRARTVAVFLLDLGAVQLPAALFISLTIYVAWYAWWI